MRDFHSEQGLAPSGLAATPALRWGSHVGHLYSTGAELNDVLVPYFKAGLDNNERCLWVADAPVGADAARAALRDAVPDLDERERTGQIEIADGDAFYNRSEPIEAAEIVAGLLAREEAALAAGYAGLRTNGNCGWVGRHHWPEFRHYESLVSDSIADRRLICMCSYDPEKLHASQMIDVADRHDLIVGRLRGGAVAVPDHDFQADLDAVAAIEAVPALLKAVCRVTGLGFAAVARVTGERWVCLAAEDRIGFGLAPGGELPVASTLCREIWESTQAIVIDHVARDAIYRDHHTPATYGFQSYISVPIVRRDGSVYGTLCAIDPAPAELDTPDVIELFRAFADLIAFQLETGGRLAAAEASLLDAQAKARLRDQFMAVLGHDLRAPIAAVIAGAHLLGKTELDDRGRMIVDGIGTSGTRMLALVDDVMDFARSQLGSGMVAHKSDEGLAAAIEHAIGELRLAHPERAIASDLRLTRAVAADTGHLARVVSNLVTNALKYGARDAPVRIEAMTNGDFVLSVVNQGPAIRPEIRDRLFAPFVRGDVRPEQQGLGLGLYIVAEIARAHGGTIAVASSDAETRFTLRIPLA